MAKQYFEMSFDKSKCSATQQTPRRVCRQKVATILLSKHSPVHGVTVSLRQLNLPLFEVHPQLKGGAVKSA